LRKGACFVVVQNLVSTVSENSSFVSHLVVRCLVSDVSRLLCLVSSLMLSRVVSSLMLSRVVSSLISSRLDPTSFVSILDTILYYIL
jgi:hypothetical protein